ncbi:MAG: CPBP family intramembrane glutamic endopeptidase [Planctomycetota bacterium]
MTEASPHHPARLWAELLLLFVGGPILLTIFPWVLGGGRLFPFLWISALACMIVLFRDRSFDRGRLWIQQPTVGDAAAASGSRRTRLLDHLGWIALRWVILGLLIIFVYGLFAGKVVLGLRVPVEVYGLPRRMPGLFFTIAVFYPWVSVYPQNVIYRAFFCHRYAPILGGGWPMILVNAALFSFGHFMFGNWIVLALTFVGGILFTRTYLRSGSMLLSVIEHALYGVLCFSIGIGVYLLYGAVS